MDRRQWQGLAVAAALAVALGACECAPGTFMLDAFKNNITERLDEVERELRVLEATPVSETTGAWIASLRDRLERARRLAGTLEEDVAERGFAARTELGEVTHELELDLGRGTPAPGEPEPR